MEEHFDGMKRGFEEKTGRLWTPLRAWKKEEWGWERDGQEERDDGWDMVDGLEV
jgi:hypothetical protein